MYTEKMRAAVRFSIHTHEVHQKQKRFGKDVAYITHPLTVGIILAHAGAKEEVIMAGILHDTIEDSILENKVTHGILEMKFGKEVADLVGSVSEVIEPHVSWEERKANSLAHIAHFSHGSLLVKSADVLANNVELLDDHGEAGDHVFTRFGGGKEKTLKNQIAVIDAILKKWQDNPLAKDLTHLREGLVGLLGAT